MTTIRKAYRLKLYPAAAQRLLLARHAGACRWLWNHLLAMQQARHEADGTFVFFHDMSKLLPGLKEDHPWLADAPSNALVRVCKNLDRALRDGFRKDGPRRGFPRFKVRGKCRESFYVINQAMRIDGSRVVLPKTGSVRFRTGRVPEGRIVGGAVSRTADDWFLTVQCELEVETPIVAPQAQTVVGVDLGLKDLMVASDGVVVGPPRHLRKALRRLRRAQRVLARRRKGSANRCRQAALVARIHAGVANRRADATHKATRALVDRASAVITENPHVRGMMRNRRVALSFADAAWGEALRQIAYKCEWAGKAHHQVGRFEPSTQTCSSCGARKNGGEKLSLSNRTFRCECGHAMDRDGNAALNLRRLGLEALCASVNPILIEDVGRVTPERDGPSGPSDACGDPSAGPMAIAIGRHGSPKQEVRRATSHGT